MKRYTIIFILFLTGLSIATVLTKQSITQDIVPTDPPKATVGQQIAKEITDPGMPNKVPVEGKDFTVHDKKYFEDGSWLVATVAPVKANAADPATIIMHLENGSYVTVLGPGTAFPKSTLSGLPDSVIVHLKIIGRVLED